MGKPWLSETRVNKVSKEGAFMPSVRTELVVYGPYRIPFDSHGRGTSKRIKKEHVKEFWARESVQMVRQKQGCYIFALAAAKGHMPWYVGQAKRNFEQESFQYHKLTYYNDVYL